MKYLSVCSGIEAATVAWHDLGWEPAGFSEIEKFPSQVLDHHYPTVTNYGDMTNFKEWDIGTIDLLVGGTPCQSFSVAGLRKGMADPRGNLALVYCAMLDHFRPQWFVWENVPGVLSSNGGRDFGSFLGALAELRYGFAYRVLDAQNFGVPQRRRRVFVVGYLGDWRRAATVLFERESLRWNTKKSRKEREDVAKCLTTGIGTRFDGETDTFVTQVYETHPHDSRIKEMGNTCQTVTSRRGTGGGNVPIALAENTIGRQPQNGGNGNGFTVGGPMYTLNATGVHGVTQPTVLMDQGGSVMNVMQDGTVGTLRRETHGHEPSILQNMAVRRLTPVECERLQGFPNSYTNIKPNGKQTPDGPRYKAVGNSMAVPVMKWIGERIDNADIAQQTKEKNG